MTLQEKINQISNNFSREEKIFKQKTGNDLLSEESFKNTSTHLSVSLIIPAFKSHNTIVPVIKSIANQSFIKHGGKIEIIICDDGSAPPLFQKIFSFKDILDIKYIYSFKNRGAGASRDDAIKVAKNDVIIFIDSDIIIPSCFIENHLLVHSTLTQNNIVVSFRENVSLSDERIYNLQSWSKGNMNLGDHRTSMTFKKGWVIKKSEETLVNKKFTILEETNYFKDFGFGRKYFIWTLPMMVMTCAMSVPTHLVKKITPTPKQLSGWGFNDTCMAVKMISRGVKVIPNLNSTVLHVLEKNHMKPNKIKNREFLKNEKVYKKLLRQKINE